MEKSMLEIKRNGSQPSMKGHWHGAINTTAMTHIAITEKLNGKVVDWLEHVSDQTYQSGCALCKQ
jgi:hypothetical protein